MSEAQYAIGVDLGTTHCALSYVDPMLSEGDRVAQRVLPIPQVTAPGNVEGKQLLPSFLYLPHAQEFDASGLSLPWDPSPAHLVGELPGTREPRPRSAWSPAPRAGSAITG